MRNLDAALAVQCGHQVNVGSPGDDLLDQFQIHRVVVNIEQSLQPCSARHMQLCQYRRVAFFNGKARLIDRDKFKPEHTSHPDRAFRTNYAPHLFDQSLGHHEANTCAFLAAGLLAEMTECLKELLQLFRTQSLTCVPDSHENPSRRACGAFHLDHSLPDIVFDGVGKQVD